MDIRQFVELCDVENNFAFLPRGDLTFCNCYAKVVLASQGIFIPNIKANDLYDWIEKNTIEWFDAENDIQDVITDAKIAIVKGAKHGHIAVEVVQFSGVWTWAGTHNRKAGRLTESFGAMKPTIFYHISNENTN